MFSKILLAEKFLWKLMERPIVPRDARLRLRRATECKLKNHPMLIHVHLIHSLQYINQFSCLCTHGGNLVLDSFSLRRSINASKNTYIGLFEHTKLLWECAQKGHFWFMRNEWNIFNFSSKVTVHAVFQMYALIFSIWKFSFTFILRTNDITILIAYGMLSCHFIFLNLFFSWLLVRLDNFS